MEQKSLEKATELLAALLIGEPVEAKNGKNTGLYEAYHESGEVSDALELMLKKLNLRVYEYNYGLYVHCNVFFKGVRSGTGNFVSIRAGRWIEWKSSLS